MPILQTTGLTKRFGGLLAVCDLDLDIRQGEIFGLVGLERRRKVDRLQPDYGGRASYRRRCLFRRTEDNQQIRSLPRTRGTSSGHFKGAFHLAR